MTLLSDHQPWSVPRDVFLRIQDLAPSEQCRHGTRGTAI